MRAPLEAATYFAAGSVLVFLAGSAVILPWWRRESEPVRSMMLLSGAFLLLLGPSVLHYAVGLTLSDAVFAWFVCGGMVTVGVLHLLRLWWFWRVQRVGRSRRSRPP